MTGWETTKPSLGQLSLLQGCIIPSYTVVEIMYHRITIVSESHTLMPHNTETKHSCRWLIAANFVQCSDFLHVCLA